MILLCIFRSVGLFPVPCLSVLSVSTDFNLHFKWFFCISGTGFHHKRRPLSMPLFHNRQFCSIVVLCSLVKISFEEFCLKNAVHMGVFWQVLGSNSSPEMKLNELLCSMRVTGWPVKTGALQWHIWYIKYAQSDNDYMMAGRALFVEATQFRRTGEWLIRCSKPPLCSLLLLHL